MEGSLLRPLNFPCVSVWTSSTLCSFFPTINTEYKLQCDFRAKLLNHDLRCHPEPSPETEFSEGVVSFLPSLGGEAPWIGPSTGYVAAPITV